MGDNCPENTMSPFKIFANIERGLTTVSDAGWLLFWLILWTLFLVAFTALMVGRSASCQVQLLETLQAFLRLAVA